MTDRPWTPDHPVGADLAAALVGAAFPELGGAAPSRVGAGWDCDVWRFGDVAFRFPRRRVAIPLLVTERRVLGWLAPRLPLAVPTPAFLGEPSAAFDAPFWGHTLVPGRTGDQAAPDDAGRAAAAPALAGFLRTLHALDPAEALAAGVPDGAARADVGRSAARAETGLRLLAGSRWAAPAAEAGRRLAAPPPAVTAGFRPVHGDLYARHLLFGPEGGPDGGLSGVIDWGDVSVSDPAMDLAIAYTFLPPAAREAFFAAYGPVDAATRARARAFGLARYGVNLLAYAVDVGDRPLEAEAGRGLLNALA